MKPKDLMPYLEKGSDRLAQVVDLMVPKPESVAAPQIDNATNGMWLDEASDYSRRLMDTEQIEYIRRMMQERENMERQRQQSQYMNSVYGLASSSVGMTANSLSSSAFRSEFLGAMQAARQSNQTSTTTTTGGL